LKEKGWESEKSNHRLFTFDLIQTEKDCLLLRITLFCHTTVAARKNEHLLAQKIAKDLV
jgi:hypothetical protein